MSPNHQENCVSLTARGTWRKKPGLKNEALKTSHRKNSLLHTQFILYINRLLETH